MPHPRPGSRPQGAGGPLSDLRRVLRDGRRRLAARRAVEAAIHALPLAAAVAAALVLTWRMLRRDAASAAALIPPAEVVLGVALVLGATAGAVALVARVRRSPTPGDVALLLDRHFQTRETLATAAWLADTDRGALAEASARRALETLGRRAPREAFPWRLPARRRLASGLLALLLAGLVPLPARPSHEDRREPDPAVVAAAEQLAESLAPLTAALESTTTDEDVRELVAEAERTARRLQQQPLTPDEAELALRGLEQSLADAERERRAAELPALRRALSELEREELLRRRAREDGEGVAASLEERLQRLADEFSAGTSFDDRELQRLAARLSDAADMLREAAPELAESLEDVAAALREGDLVDAARRLEELAASGALREGAGDAADGEALAAARHAVRQALAGMGRPLQDAGFGRDGDGEGGSAPDWGVGTTNEAVPRRPAGPGHQADRQSDETSRWREDYEALHESQRLPDATGRPTRVDGRIGEGEHVSVPARTTAAGAGRSDLPAAGAAGRRTAADETAVPRERVPPGYEDAVRRYFASLTSGDAVTGPTVDDEEGRP